jgi:ATP-dependent Zn protease
MRICFFWRTHFPQINTEPKSLEESSKVTNAAHRVRNPSTLIDDAQNPVCSSQSTHTHIQIFTNLYNSDEAQKSVSKNQFTHLNQHKRVSEISTTHDEAQKSGCSYKSTEFHTSYYKRSGTQKSQFAHLLNQHKIVSAKLETELLILRRRRRRSSSNSGLQFLFFFPFLSFFLSFFLNVFDETQFLRETNKKKQNTNNNNNNR